MSPGCITVILFQINSCISRWDDIDSVRSLYEYALKVLDLTPHKYPHCDILNKVKNFTFLSFDFSLKLRYCTHSCVFRGWSQVVIYTAGSVFLWHILVVFIMNVMKFIWIFPSITNCAWSQSAAVHPLFCH